MGASDMSAWRRQNSDPLAVDIVLDDGTPMKGNILMPRDKNLRDLFNASELFFEFECFRLGPMVLSKSSVRSVRQNTVPAGDQLEKRLKSLERSDPFQILGVERNANREAVRQAYITMARNYHPDRFMRIDMPGEMVEYVNAMARRINHAYSELQGLFGAAGEGE
jgi:hypothetical protein